MLKKYSETWAQDLLDVENWKPEELYLWMLYPKKNMMGEME